jgi:2-hydroxycyclohexanecarboxyl-CoA dehydrogenase
MPVTKIACKHTVHKRIIIAEGMIACAGGDAMRGLTGKTAIVTGGGQGIGRAITLRLAEEGCNVAIFDLKPDIAAETAKASRGGRIAVYGVDVSERAAVDRAVRAVEEKSGPIWLLVNNAGWDRPMPFLKTDRALWDKIIRINLYGSLNMHHAVCPGMVDRGGGRVVNIASDAARVGTSDEAVYSACKGGLIAFTKSVARELARKGVLLNAVCPGPTNTPMMQEVLGTGEQAVKWKDAMVRGIPLKRMGEPEDYAGIVAFLASDDGAYITGQTISVSGGMNMI